MTKANPRKLHNGHFAFMRALAQGIDERTSWDRYLRLEGEHTDLRTVRRTVAWIRDEFAAAARREKKPGTARLILLDAKRLPASLPIPTLAEFAAVRGLEDFSEADQLEAYEEAYPRTPSFGSRAGKGASPRHVGERQTNTTTTPRRARVITRQLEALRWLQDLIAQEPKATDSVASWLHPALAERLERGGLPTLADLVARINGVGARWWTRVRGVGERKAGRIVDWLRANEGVLGVALGSHVAHPRRKLSAARLDAVRAPATAIMPLEKLIVPSALDGAFGTNRAPGDQCGIAAVDDLGAVLAWMDEKAKATANGALTATGRSYRREAERLLLWSLLKQRKALSSLTEDDAGAYRQFLAEPPSAWCGPRYHQRWSPLWRPFEGPLKPIAMRQSLIIVRSLFTFLVERRYVLENPFAHVVLPTATSVPLGTSRSLSIAQWNHVSRILDRHVETEVQRRLRRAMRWLYATGLRLAEVTALHCGDLSRVSALTDQPPGPDASWQLRVTGKKGKARSLLIPSWLIEELADDLERHGHDRAPDAPANRQVPLLARFDSDPRHPAAWSASGLTQALKAFLAKAARQYDGGDAEVLLKASTHWLRHSHAVHMLAGSDEMAPASLDVVRNNLGHSLAGTTSMYRSAAHAQRLADEADTHTK